jgi:predicted SprT family Zn-dependent metalloprotease
MTKYHFFNLPPKNPNEQKLIKLRRFARIMFDKYKVDFSFEIVDTNEDWVGLCNFNTKQILLKKLYAERNSLVDSENIIRHEIAHFLVGINHGHDLVWQNKAKELGVYDYQYSVDFDNCETFLHKLNN